MRATLQNQCDQLRAEQRVNRLENIAVRSVEVSEAWQEGRQDFVTVRFLANLLEHTVDESGTRAMVGSRTEPVKFEEYWTFARPVGPNPGGSARSNDLNKSTGGGFGTNELGPRQTYDGKR